MVIAPGEEMQAKDMTDLTMLPKGLILMFHGSFVDNVTVPGWYICDGRATPYGQMPDLRNKFIRGGETSGQTGGQKTVTLTTANLPAHNHLLSGLDNHTGYFLVDDHVAVSSFHGGVFSPGAAVNYDASSGGGNGRLMQMNAAHTSGGKPPVLGDNDAAKSFKSAEIDALPEYYTLIFIKKMV